MDESVKNNEAESRFQVEASGFKAFLEYDIDKDVMTLIHTEVPPQLEGKGLGSKIVKAALDSAREQGMKIVPQCPFVAGYIERHPEYGELLGGKTP